MKKINNTIHYNKDSIHFNKTSIHFNKVSIYFNKNSIHFNKNSINYNKTSIHFNKNSIHFNKNSIHFNKNSIHFNKNSIHFNKNGDDHTGILKLVSEGENFTKSFKRYSWLNSIKKCVLSVSQTSSRKKHYKRFYIYFPRKFQPAPCCGFLMVLFIFQPFFNFKFVVFFVLLDEWILRWGFVISFYTDIHICIWLPRKKLMGKDVIFYFP